LKLLAVYEEKDYFGLVFELFSGGNLKEYLRERGLLTEKKAALIMRNVLKGLQYLNSMNIMHRDVKPENILFRSSQICDKHIVLADFGLATSNAVTEYIYYRCGSPGYVAPEILNLKDPNGHYGLSCDLFSVGVTLFFSLTGKMPYCQSSLQEQRKIYLKYEAYDALSENGF